MTSTVSTRPGTGAASAPGGRPRPWTSRAPRAAAVAALLAVPLFTTPQWQAIAVFSVIYAIAALGLHVLTGMAGQVSLGHSAFVAVGGYTAVWLGADQGLPIWVWLPAAALVSAAVGLLVVPFAARLRGLYLAVVTLAVLFVAEYLWDVWEPLTGGSKGAASCAAARFAACPDATAFSASSAWSPLSRRTGSRSSSPVSTGASGPAFFGGGTSCVITAASTAIASLRWCGALPSVAA